MNKPDPHTIRALAYRLWEQRGKPLGSPDDDWREAERQLGEKQSAAAPASKKIDESIKQSFPASDPPGSCIPDEPPANAEAKWAAAGVDRDELSRAIEDSAPGPAEERKKALPRRGGTARSNDRKL